MRRRQPWSKWSAWASLLGAGCGGGGLVRGGLWRTAGATDGTNWVAGRGSLSSAVGAARSGQELSLRSGGEAGEEGAVRAAGVCGARDEIGDGAVAGVGEAALGGAGAGCGA